MAAIPGVLLDIDGVLTVSWQPLPGAVAAVAALRAQGLPLRFLTNTTSRTREAIAYTLREAGFEVQTAEILTAAAATAAYLRARHPGARCWLLCSGDVTADLEGVTLVNEDSPADVVVIGGAVPEFTYQRCNHAFRLLRDGARLVVMHRNLLWKTAGGIDLDSGAYIAGLEQAAVVAATVVGKPALAFYQAALADLCVPAAAAVMVGDDVQADIGGAKEAGIAAVLVCTGKFRESDLGGAVLKPDAVLDSVAGLPGWIKKQ